MSDKQKLLEWINNYCNDYMTFEDIVDSYIGSIKHHKEFSAFRINEFTLMLNERLVNALDKMEVATRVAHERATYIKCYLEGKMYESEEVAKQCVDLQIENAKAILERTEKVTL